MSISVPTLGSCAAPGGGWEGGKLGDTATMKGLVEEGPPDWGEDTGEVTAKGLVELTEVALDAGGPPTNGFVALPTGKAVTAGSGGCCR